MINTFHQFYDLGGSLSLHKVKSPSMSGAQMGQNQVFTGVYLPEGDHQNLGVLVVLAPWLSGGLEMMTWRAFKESFPQRIDRLIASGKIPPVVAVFPQMFTPYGGSQYSLE